MSVFISWAGPDREVKNVIATKLREERIEYFDSDEFCKSDFSKECIEKIRISSVFIVIISDASMDERSYVFNEVVEARRLEGEGLLNILVYKVTDNPYTERFAFNLNHISDANHVARTKRTSGVSGIDCLIKRVKALLERRLEGNPEKPCDVHIPVISGVTVSRTKYFVDGSRDDTLAQIDEAFERSNVIILSEIYGFGKKSVIKRYIQQHPEISAVEIQGMHDSPYSFFLTNLSFRNINDAVFNKPNDNEVILKKFDFLQKLGKNDMIVISDINIDGEEDELICSLLSKLRCRVVFITQDSAADYADVFPVITVGKMKNEHLFELFFHYYRCANDREREILIPYLQRFFDDVGGHTKAVELTASVLYKEMRATTEEVISRLSAGSDDNRELKDKIFDVFAGLLSLERFSDSERRTLLLISLMANPIIEEKNLLFLMEECGLFDRSAISSLDDHRWITYDMRTKTVYVEPIIAQIAVNEFSRAEEDVCRSCLEHFKNTLISKEYHISSSNDQSGLMAQAENFFNMMKLDIIANVIGVCRSQIFAQVKDLDEMRTARERFLEHYNYISFSEEHGLLTGFLEENDEPEDNFEDSLGLEDGFDEKYGTDEDFGLEDSLDDDMEPEEGLEEDAARWVHSLFVAALKASEMTPLLYTFTNNGLLTTDDLRSSLIDKDMEELIDIEIGDTAFSTIISELGTYADSEDLNYLCLLLCASVLYAFYKKEFVTMQNKLDELLDFLQDSPQTLEDSTLCGVFLSLVKILHSTYILSNTVTVGASFYERMLIIDWQVDIRYRLLLMYSDCLLAMREENELALSAIEAANEIFEDAMLARNASESEYVNSRQELALYYSNAFVRLSEIDEAIDKFNEIKLLDPTLSCTQPIANLIDRIAEHLIAADLPRAIAFVEENRSLIHQYVEKSEDTDPLGESLRSLLLMSEMYESNPESGFAAGGLLTDEGYYQKYSKDKKNNFFVMMSYERAVSKIRLYNFSGYTNEELAEHSLALRRRAASGEGKTSIMPEAFALVSEAGYRILGYRHHKVQYLGAAAMLDGKIAEILNGEGKTYTITLVAYVNSLYSSKTVVLDESRYLTKRNFGGMRGVYELLGISVGYMCSGEDRNMLFDSSKEQIIYADLASLGFSLLYNEQSASEGLLDLSVMSVVVDEADSLLIESANVPITINGTLRNNSSFARMCASAYDLALEIRDDELYYSINKFGSVSLNREIKPLIEERYNVSYDNLSQVNAIKSLEEAVRLALYCFTLVNGRDFFIKNGIIYRENPSTGSLYEINERMGLFLALRHGLPEDRYWSKLCQKPTIHNTTHVYSILSRFGELCGTSATVCSFKKEFKDIYDLDVVAIPTALPIRRVDRTVGLYLARESKNEDILNTISEKHEKMQPTILIVESIEECEYFSDMLDEMGISHTVINGLNAEKSPEVFASAGIYGSVVIATQLANRGIDIKLGGDAERMTMFSLIEDGVDVSGIDGIVYRIPSEEVRSSELYRRYSATLEKNKAIVAANKRKVVEVGGLCVISTTTYSDMRIEQQIRGRAGRQGEVGESYVFISIDDNVLYDVMYKLKESGLFQRLTTDLPIVDAPVLRRQIENAKSTIHHRTFARMKNAAFSSVRTDKSKNEIFRLKYGILKGTVAFDELIRIWCGNDNNIQSVREIIAGNPMNACGAVFRIWKCYPRLFEEINEQNISERLLEITRLYVSESTLEENMQKALFVAETINLLSLHLTDMYDAERSYDAIDIKNSDKFFAELYAKNLSNHISDSIGRWLMRLQNANFDDGI